MFFFFFYRNRHTGIVPYYHLVCSWQNVKSSMCKNKNPKFIYKLLSLKKIQTAQFTQLTHCNSCLLRRVVSSTRETTGNMQCIRHATFRHHRTVCSQSWSTRMQKAQKVRFYHYWSPFASTLGLTIPLSICACYFEVHSSQWQWRQTVERARRSNTEDMNSGLGSSTNCAFSI